MSAVKPPMTQTCAHKLTPTVPAMTCVELTVPCFSLEYFYSYILNVNIDIVSVCLCVEETFSVCVEEALW